MMPRIRQDEGRRTPAGDQEGPLTQQIASSPLATLAMNVGNFLLAVFLFLFGVWVVYLLASLATSLMAEAGGQRGQRVAMYKFIPTIGISQVYSYHSFGNKQLTDYC